MPRARSRNPQNRHYPPETEEECYQLWKQGITLKTIEERTGVSSGTIGAWVARKQWKGRYLAEMKEAGPEAAKRIAPRGEMRKQQQIATMAALLSGATEEMPEEFKGRSRAELGELYMERLAQQAMRFPALLAQLPDELLLDRADKVAKLDGMFREALGIKDAPPAPLINISLVSGATGLPPLKSANPPEQDAVDVEAEVVSDAGQDSQESDIEAAEATESEG